MAGNEMLKRDFEAAATFISVCMVLGVTGILAVMISSGVGMKWIKEHCPPYHSETRQVEVISAWYEPDIGGNDYYLELETGDTLKLSFRKWEQHSEGSMITVSIAQEPALDYCEGSKSIIDKLGIWSYTTFTPQYIHRWVNIQGD
jgi:hypothetical protein